jgi:predicted DNA-binding protein
MDLIAFRVPPEVKEKLERMAKKQRRSLANFIRLIVLDWLEQHEEEED